MSKQSAPEIHDQEAALNKEIGERIRQARLSSPVKSQEKLAALLGVSFQQVQKIEKGANRASAARLLQIAQHLGKPIQWFYGRRAEELFKLAGAGDDLERRFFSTPYASDLARDYLAIPGNRARNVVATVAREFAEADRGKVNLKRAAGAGR